MYLMFRHELVFIDQLGETRNSGEHTFTSQDFRDRKDEAFLDFEVGLISINQTTPPRIGGRPIAT